MKSSRESAGSRREFLRAGARGGLLCLLVAASRLAARSGASARERCVNRGICRGCAVFAACGLPQALSAKAAQSGG